MTETQKKRFQVLRFRYKSTPQYLDQEQMIKYFNSTLHEGTIHKKFESFARKGSKHESIKDLHKNIIVYRKHRIQAKYDRADLKTCVYRCWLLIWSAAFKYQENKEKEFLTF